MKPKEEISPDHQAEKNYSVPIGEKAELVGPDNIGKIMVACIDQNIAAYLGVTALMFHRIYVDTDGKVYTDAIQKENFLSPPEASAVRWTDHDKFMDTTEMLNSLTVGRVLGRIRTAVCKGDLPPEKPKKKGRGRRTVHGFDIF